ncbi:MAG TPA: CHAD domain-containing protein [Solirubrobacterales bacterium]|jgi:CHAD domain-containing protein
MSADAERDRSYRLERGEEAAAGVTRIAAGRAEEALERLRGFGSGEVDAAEAIHGARKDLKKLRTVLRLLRGSLPKATYREEARRYRDAGRALSASRDAEVKLAMLEGLGKRPGDLPGDAFETWRAILDRDREAAANATRDLPAIEEAMTAIEAGLAGIEGWQLRSDSWDLIGNGLRRSYRRGRRTMRAAAEEPSEASFHEWRKRAKDLWYALRILSDAWPAPLEAAADEAHKLSELLGDHHDLALLREDLHQRRLGEEETRALEAAIDDRQGELVAEALALGDRLYAEKPKAFDRRIRSYWRAWRG